MKRLPIVALPVVLSLFTACTPVARGAQPDFPIENPDALTPVAVKPGQTVFVTVPYTRAAIEDDNEYDRYFDAIEFDYSTVRSGTDKVPDAYRDAPWLTLKGTDAPAGITVSLSKANIGRIVSQTKVTGTSVNVKYGERFRLLYKVTVAPDFKAPEAGTSDSIKASVLSSFSAATRAAVKDSLGGLVAIEVTLADATPNAKTAYLLLDTNTKN